MNRPLTLTQDEIDTVRRAIDDAWYYRLGDARNLADPDLDPDDRDLLVRYQSLIVAHPDLEF